MQRDTRLWLSAMPRLNVADRKAFYLAMLAVTLGWWVSFRILAEAHVSVPDPLRPLTWKRVRSAVMRDVRCRANKLGSLLRFSISAMTFRP